MERREARAHCSSRSSQIALLLALINELFHVLPEPPRLSAVVVVVLVVLVVLSQIGSCQLSHTCMETASKVANIEFLWGRAFSSLPFLLMSAPIAGRGHIFLTSPRLDRTPHSNSLQGLLTFYSRIRYDHTTGVLPMCRVGAHPAEVCVVFSDQRSWR